MTTPDQSPSRFDNYGDFKRVANMRLNEVIRGVPASGGVAIGAGLSVRFAEDYIFDEGEGYGLTHSWPVVAFEPRTGLPIVAVLGENGVFAVTERDYRLVRDDAVVVPASVDDPSGIVEVITGSDRELDYTLPDGSSYRGVVPLWGRRADGSVVALLTADVVPTRRVVERDPSGDITAVVEEAPAD